jgi:Resolvase, N terminal domain
MLVSASENSIPGEAAMQAIGYVRVSTEDQARDGVSLSTQQAKLEAYALVKDWTLVDVIRQEFIAALSTKTGIPASELVQSRGGLPSA